MNLETLLEIVPKVVQTKDGFVSLVVRWSKSEDGWIVGYGIHNTIKGRENCGRGKTLLEALIDLGKKEKSNDQSNVSRGTVAKK